MEARTNNAPEKRKDYSPPTLVEYGSMKDIVQAGRSGMVLDAQSKPAFYPISCL